MSRRKGNIASPIKQKILLMLAAGTALSLTYTFKQQRRLAKEVMKEWKNIDRQRLYRLLDEFHHDRLISYDELPTGEVQITLTEDGRRQILRFDVDEMVIRRPLHWDGCWRVVFFDIPEAKRQSRDELRNKLQEIGFMELQKSAWVFPFDCQKEVDFLTEFFELRNFVRLAEIKNLTNDADLRLKFKLY
ncbi:MAG: Transcriptional regulator, PaaX family protein [Candidatus Woesebacteria bacterium GW2011_GWA1_39_21b]|uniref:Transcriptional repressor PaaX-like central Cas2-like domain-containing protein n=3 Tax=Patescibacteria group TaxID=1783273 RepID=A0A1G2QH52_9BACT|nr:MAG: Transcriptional regulator, PaaX family protein [Candidatus Woesebacteria bacterium GW2011_GWA1_39_21b]KKS77199.1 MAG: Transcriptional regulator, PaaX family protein [Parcubacteria group bacterium GW2011_GWB1_42_9]KKS89772.1 MAG: Transcriptional regulator, PaaX family protein [Parcubacteria group bacterium GW2011_GWC1_43_11b]OHA59342.1 MAG: hypothetical protein A2370_00130 [Candidatus Vogelbacteria bacterium RIFOXYB1_FULL_42_16]OHA60273.1 MAG: hypothetical protein A2607_01305 [Candidatus